MAKIEFKAEEKAIIVQKIQMYFLKNWIRKSVSSMPSFCWTFSQRKSVPIFTIKGCPMRGK